MNDAIEGVHRKPIAKPARMLKMVQKKFPNIDGWFVHFGQVVTTMMEASDYAKIGHDKPQTCQLKVLGHGNKCGRESDFIFASITLIKADGSRKIVLDNSRIRYYCSPCVYTVMNRAIKSISKAEHLTVAIEEDMTVDCGDILLQKTLFAEDAIGRSAEVIETKYPDTGDKMIEETRKKFNGES